MFVQNNFYYCEKNRISKLFMRKNQKVTILYDKLPGGHKIEAIYISKINKIKLDNQTIFKIKDKILHGLFVYYIIDYENLFELEIPEQYIQSSKRQTGKEKSHNHPLTPIFCL